MESEHEWCCVHMRSSVLRLNSDLRAEAHHKIWASSYNIKSWKMIWLYIPFESCYLFHICHPVMLCRKMNWIQCYIYVSHTEVICSDRCTTLRKVTPEISYASGFTSMVILSIIKFKEVRRLSTVSVKWSQLGKVLGRLWFTWCKFTHYMS